MIYLEKDGAKATTNDEQIAISFETQGFRRLAGRERLVAVLISSVKSTALELLIPMICGYAAALVADDRSAAVVLGIGVALLLRGTIGE